MIAGLPEPQGTAFREGARRRADIAACAGHMPISQNAARDRGRLDSGVPAIILASRDAVWTTVAIASAVVILAFCNIAS